ncbi:MAG: TolC family protein [Planctomycetota bacterium]
MCGALLAAGCATAAEVDRESLPPIEIQEPIPGAALPASATPPEEVHLGPDATLDDFRRYAARHNPGLEALQHEWSSARQRAPQARALPDPRFGYTEFVEEVQTRTGPQERKFSLSQSFPWFGKRGLRGSVEEEGARVVWHRFLGAELALDYELRRTYAEYYFLGKSILITRDNLELLSRLESVARQKLAAGASNHPDIIRLQVELGRQEDRLRALQEMRRPLTAKLNSILNRPLDTEIPWPTELPSLEAEIDAEKLVLEMEAQNPELRALQHEIRRAKLQRKLAGKEYFPDFSVGIETINTGSAVNPNTPDSGDDPWALMFTVEVPIWFAKYRAGEREAEERWRSARRHHVDQKNRLLSDLEVALYDRRDAQRRIFLYQNTLIPKAEESLVATETAFRAGTADFLDLIDAQRVLLEFQLIRERALADRLRAHAELDRLVGRYVLNPDSQLKEERQ